MSQVPTTNINALYTNTSIGTIASPTIMDSAIQDIVSTINTNDTAFTTHETANPIDHPDASVTNSKVATGIDAVKLADGSVTNTEFQYLGNVTSDLQTQLNARQPLDLTLTALATFNTNGLMKQTSADTFTAVTAPTGAVVGTTDTQTLTNKSIDASQITGTILIARLPVAIPATNIGSGTVSNTEFGYLDGVTQPIQTQINGIVLGSIPDGSLTNIKLAPGIDAAKLADGTVSNAELQYINSVTSNVQTQLNTIAFGTVSEIENAKTGHGAVGNGSTDDTTAIQASVTSGLLSSVYVPKGNYPITTLDNKNGVDFQGKGKVVKNGVLYNSYAYQNKDIFGVNYLSSFHKKILAGTATKVIFSGDSTTAGDAIVSARNTVDQLFLSAAQYDGFANLTVLNRGQSGKSTNDWVTTYVAGDLSAAPDLLVLRWGVNDPFYGRTLAQFIADLRSGLTTIRASRNLASLSIILMTPNSTSDTPNGRNELWYESMNPAVREAARDFNCCFIDTYSLFQDSRNASDWMDDPFGDGRHIHPIDVGSYFITSAIYDVALPMLLKVRYGFKQARTLAAINYYVDPVSGSDSNTGAVGSKFKTIQHAVDILPLGIDHTANIFVSTGTSTEQIEVSGFTGKANIIITGGTSSTDAANYKFKNITIKNCMIAVTVQGFESTETTGISFSIYNSQWAAIVFGRTTAANTIGVGTNSCFVYVIGCLISSKTTAAIQSAYLSTVFSENNSGTSNVVGLLASQASTLGKSGTQPAGTTAESATFGGVIR